jgi:hypothetical protein
MSEFNIGDKVVCIVDIYDKNRRIRRTESYSLIKNIVYVISYVDDKFIKIKDINGCKFLSKKNFLKLNDYRKLKIKSILCK